MRKTSQAPYPIDLLTGLFQQSRPAAKLPPGWSERVMASISSSSRINPVQFRQEQKRKAMAYVALRFAGAAGVAALALFLYAVIYGPDLETQAAKLLMDYPDLSSYLRDALWT